MLTENINNFVLFNPKQEGKEIKAELTLIQYNNNPVIELPKTEFGYEWSTDENTGEMKELEQKLIETDLLNVVEVKRKL